MTKRGIQRASSVPPHLFIKILAGEQRAEASGNESHVLKYELFVKFKNNGLLV